MHNGARPLVAGHLYGSTQAKSDTAVAEQRSAGTRVDAATNQMLAEARREQKQETHVSKFKLAPTLLVPVRPF